MMSRRLWRRKYQVMFNSQKQHSIYTHTGVCTFWASQTALQQLMYMYTYVYVRMCVNTVRKWLTCSFACPVYYCRRVKGLYTVWVENFEGSNFRESQNFLYFEIFAGIKFRVPSQRYHMNIICGNMGCAEKRSKNIEVMATFYSIDECS